MQFTVTRDAAFPAAKIWAIIEDFGNIGWAPGIEKVEVIGDGIGMIRRIHMPGLPEAIDEQLVSIDAKTMTMKYAIPRGLPMPLDDYYATAQLEIISPTSTRIHWTADCKPRGMSEKDAEQILKGTYDMLIDWIIKHAATLA